VTRAGPIGIGGVGGSGTRVVAELVRALGTDLGTDLNGPLDNLSFTLLFKRPHRFGHTGGLVDPDDAVAMAAARTFEAVMTHGGVTPARLAHVARAVVDVGLHRVRGDVFEPHDRDAARVRTSIALGRARHALAAMASHQPPAPVAWGFKEPNSFVFLPVLFEHFAGLRYVHVVRNGLDMAYGANDAQVRNWSHLYGLRPGSGPELSATDRLRYWARANTAAADFLDGRPSGLVLRYEDVTGDAPGALGRLCEALSIEPSDEAVALAGRLRPSASSGRHRLHDHDALLDACGPEAERALARFGYLPEPSPRPNSDQPRYDPGGHRGGVGGGE